MCVQDSAVDVIDVVRLCLRQWEFDRMFLSNSRNGGRASLKVQQGPFQRAMPVGCWERLVRAVRQR